MLAAKGRLRLAPVPAYGRPCLPLRAMVRLSYRDGEHQTARASRLRRESNREQKIMRKIAHNCSNVLNFVLSRRAKLDKIQKYSVNLNRAEWESVCLALFNTAGECPVYKKIHEQLPPVSEKILDSFKS